MLGFDVADEDDEAVKLLGLYFEGIITSIEAGDWKHYPTTRNLRRELKERGLAMWKFKRADIPLADMLPNPRSCWMGVPTFAAASESIRLKVRKIIYLT